MKRRLQNKISESTATLPTAALLATLLWFLPSDRFAPENVLGWMFYAVTTYIIVEMTNVNALLRIRSRMVSSTFLVLIAAFPFLHNLQTGTLLALLLAGTFYSLFRTCDDAASTHDSFHAMLALSIASFVWPPMLLLVPLLFLCQVVWLRSLSYRSLAASLFGLLLPYWLWIALLALQFLFPSTGWDFLPPSVRSWELHFQAVIAPFSGPFFWQLFPKDALSDYSSFITHHPFFFPLFFTLLIGSTGFIHYVRRSYDDKIRVRMCYNTLLAFQLILSIWIVLQPQYFPQLFPMLILTISAPVAHLFALTHTWLTNAWFLLSALFLSAIATFSYISS